MQTTSARDLFLARDCSQYIDAAAVKKPRLLRHTRKRTEAVQAKLVRLEEKSSRFTALKENGLYEKGGALAGLGLLGAAIDVGIFKWSWGPILRQWSTVPSIQLVAAVGCVVLVALSVHLIMALMSKVEWPRCTNWLHGLVIVPPAIAGLACFLLDRAVRFVPSSLPIKSLVLENIWIAQLISGVTFCVAAGALTHLGFFYLRPRLLERKVERLQDRLDNLRYLQLETEGGMVDRPVATGSSPEPPSPAVPPKGSNGSGDRLSSQLPMVTTVLIALLVVGCAQFTPQAPEPFELSNVEVRTARAHVDVDWTPTLDQAARERAFQLIGSSAIKIAEHFKIGSIGVSGFGNQGDLERRRWVAVPAVPRVDCEQLEGTIPEHLQGTRYEEDKSVHAHYRAMDIRDCRAAVQQAGQGIAVEQGHFLELLQVELEAEEIRSGTNTDIALQLEAANADRDVRVLVLVSDGVHNVGEIPELELRDDLQAYMLVVPVGLEQGYTNVSEQRTKMKLWRERVPELRLVMSESAPATWWQ